MTRVDTFPARHVRGASLRVIYIIIIIMIVSLFASFAAAFSPSSSLLPRCFLPYSIFRTFPACGDLRPCQHSSILEISYDGVQKQSGSKWIQPHKIFGDSVALCMANPWDLTGQNDEQNDMFDMPQRNQSKMSEATETLRRDFKAQVAESQSMPGFLRGALDPLRLKRNVADSRVAYLSRMLGAKTHCPSCCDPVFTLSLVSG